MGKSKPSAKGNKNDNKQQEPGHPYSNLWRETAIAYLKKYRPTQLTPLLEGEFKAPLQDDYNKKKHPIPKKELEEFERRKSGELQERLVDALLLFLEWCEIRNKKEKEVPQALNNRDYEYENTDKIGRYKSYENPNDPNIADDERLGRYVMFDSIWRLRFESEAISKLKKIAKQDPSQAATAIDRMINHAQGFTPDCNSNVLLQGPFLYTTFYCSTMSEEIRIVWMVTVEKIQGQFNQVMICINIANTEKASHSIVNKMCNSMTETHHFIDPTHQEKTPTSASPFEVIANKLPDVEPEQNTRHNQLRPVRFKVIDYKEIEKNRKKYQDPKALLPIVPAAEAVLGFENNLPIRIRDQNTLINALSSQENCAELVDLLQKLPQLSITLSPEEKDVIRFQGNVLLIGRSGTGKTTCAALRLWARNKLFHFLAEQYARDEEESSAADQEATPVGKEAEKTVVSEAKVITKEKSNVVNYNSVFLSLSPVLCSQVKKYYEKLDKETGEGQDIIKTQLGIPPDSDVTSSVDDKSKDKKEDSTSEAGADAGEEDEGEDKASRPEGEDKNALIKSNYNNKMFPIFVTLRRFLYMIDETLSVPFFVKGVNNEKGHFGATFNWNHEESSQPVIIRKRYVQKVSATKKSDKGRASIAELLDFEIINEKEDELDFNHNEFDEYDDYSSDDDDSDDNSEEDEDDEGEEGKKNKKVRHKIIEKIETSFEIGYNYFSTVIWPKIQSGSGFHPSLVWTEIMSYIKGSVEALESKIGYLNVREYLELGNKRTPLPQGNRSQVYDIFLKYETEKNYVKGYDLQDMIYHVYSRLLHEGYRGTVIHSITVDEVQDFTQATLRVLFNICNQPQGFFFTGDTCQTIARGVGFRFAELKTLFYNKKQANSLLKVEIPTVQQLLVNYRSHSNLLKLSNSVIELLERRFPNAIDKLKKDRGTQAGPMPVIMNTTSLDELFLLLFGEGKANTAIEFGANQVIIVRDPESKKRLPQMLQGAMVLTVYESKGLEFDDVILFDFFNDSPCEWTSFAEGTYSNQEDVNQERVAQTSLASLDSKISVAIPFSPNSALLCSELKHLYTAITRAKTRLFVFDRNVAKRSPIFNFWKVRDLVQELTTEGGLVELRETIVKKTSKESWKQQGLTMLRNHHYLQAAKCFQYSGDDAFRRKAEALDKAVEASNTLKQSIMIPGVKWTKKQIRDAQNKEQEAKIMFREAGSDFLELRLPKYAARCFASAGDQEKAGKLFESRECFEDGARCYHAAELWQRAAHCYAKCERIEEAIECLEKGNLWHELLDALSSFKQMLPEVRFEEYVRKYVPLLVENLVKPHSKAEDSWKTILDIIAIVAPEIEAKLRTSRAVSSTAADSRFCFDDTVLEFLEQHGFYELCIRLIIENKKQMDVDVEFEQDLKLQEYVGIVCYLNNNKDRAAVKRACSNLYSISPGLAVELLLRYGLWIDAADLLIETDNIVQAATVYQAFGAFEKARELYNKAIEGNVSPQLALRFLINNNLQELWSDIKKVSESVKKTSEAGAQNELQEQQIASKLLTETLTCASRLKDSDVVTKRLRALAQLKEERELSYAAIQKQVIESKDDLFIQLYLLNKLSRKNPNTFDIKLTKGLIEACENIFNIVLKHLSDTIGDDQKAREEKEDLSLFFELQDPPPFSLDRTSAGGGHPFFIVKKTNPLIKNEFKKQKNAASYYPADNRRRYFYLSLEDSYFLILEHIATLYNRFASSYLRYLQHIPFPAKWERTAEEETELIERKLEELFYCHRLVTMVGEIESIRSFNKRLAGKKPSRRDEIQEDEAEPKLVSRVITELITLIEERFSRLPLIPLKIKNCLVSVATSGWPPSSGREVFERFRLLQLASSQALFDELVRRSPSKSRGVHSLLVDMDLYQTQFNFYQSSRVLLEYLDSVTDEIPVVYSFNLIQQHISLLTVMAQSLSPNKAFYLPKSYYDKHIFALADNQKGLKLIANQVDSASVQEMVQSLFDWLIFLLECELTNDLEQDVVIACLIVASNFNIPKQNDKECFYKIRNFLAGSEMTDYWLGLVSDSRLKDGKDWDSSEFFECLDSIGDGVVEVKAKTLGLKVTLVKDFDEEVNWRQHISHHVTRLSSAIKISNFALHSKATQQYQTRLRQPYHARLASRYFLRACCKSTPTPPLVRAAMLISTEEAKLVKASMEIAQTLSTNLRLTPTHTRKLERILIELKEKRKALVKWMQKAANDQVSVTIKTTKSQNDDEFELVGGSEVKVQEIEEALKDLIKSSDQLVVLSMRQLQEIQTASVAVQQKAAEQLDPEAREKKEKAKEQQKLRGRKKQLLLQYKKMRLKGKGITFFKF